LAAGGEQNVCYSSYVDNLGGKASSIKVKDLLDKGLLFNKRELSIRWSCLVFRAYTFKAALESRTRDIIDA
jgi:hypothetical protein